MKWCGRGKRIALQTAFDLAQEVRRLSSLGSLPGGGHAAAPAAWANAGCFSMDRNGLLDAPQSATARSLRGGLLFVFFLSQCEQKSARVVCVPTSPRAFASVPISAPESPVTWNVKSFRSVSFAVVDIHQSADVSPIRPRFAEDCPPYSPAGPRHRRSQKVIPRAANSLRSSSQPRINRIWSDAW